MRKVIPDELSLFDYQANGVKHLMKQRRSLLADQQGLGKTPQAVVCTNVWAAQHIVVICPAVVRSTWQHEFTRWDTLGRKSLLITSGKQSVASDVNLLIVSYDLAATEKWKAYLTQYLEASDSVLICDEAHYLKSWSAKRTRTIIYELAPVASKLLLLTGTPMTKNIADLHPLLCAVMPKYWPSLTDFCYQYSYPFPVPFGRGVEFRGTRNVKELKDKIGSVMLRRFKDEVLKDLPPKTYSNVYLDIDRNIADRSLQLVDYVMSKLQESNPTVSGTIDETAHITTLKRDLGVAKLKPLIEWLDLYFENNPDEPIVIYAYHKLVVQGLAAYCAARKLTYCTVTGSTSQSERTKAVSEFQAGNIQVFIGNIVAAGVGITLTRASTCIIAELDWTPANLAQSVDRLHRISQTRPVIIYFMLATNSLDDHIINVITTKMQDIDKVLGNGQQTE